MPRCSLALSPLSFALSLALLLPLGSAPAQTQIPTYQANARDVVVDVVVSQGKDQPVLGLRKQDFQIFEDGKPQTIDYFEEHTPKPVPPGAVPPPSMPPNVYTNVPPVPPSDSVNVLLLDALNTDREDQSYVHQQIMKFLKTMQPGTRAAIFTLSSRLRMVQGFTSDSSALVAALNDPKFGDFITKPPQSQSMQDKKDNVWAIEKAQMMSSTPMGSISWGVMQLADFQRDLADQQNADRIDMTLQALRILARYLDGVPGRKNLIWFSSTFPVTVFPRGTVRPDQMTTTDLRDYGKAIRETADLLTVARVAVYPVGAEGVMSEHIQDPDIETNRPGPVDYEGGDAGTPGVKGASMGPYISENGAHADKIMAMSQIAEDTGGKAFYNTNDLKTATQQAIANGDHYYTLVYSPTDKNMDGSYRHIAVKLTQGKYQLAYRRGYNADPASAIVAAPDTDPLHPMMAMGMPNATQLLYRVRALPASSQPAPGAPHAGKNANLSGPVTRYSVDFVVPSNDLHLETAPNGRHGGKIELQLLAYDRDGHAVNWAGGTLVMNMTPEVYAQIQRSGIPAHFDIDLPANQEIDLETGVYDPATGKAGTLSIPLGSSPQTTASTARP